MALKSQTLAAFVATLSVSFIGSATASAQSAEWRSFGPTGGSIDVLALDPNDSSTVYAGSRAGAFKSLASGAAWRPINEGFGRSIVDYMVVDPRQPSRLFASTLTPPGFFRSINGGEAWQQVDDFHFGPSSLGAGPIANVHRVSKSDDGGETWRLLGDAESIDFVRAIQATETALFIGTHRGVLELPKDCGSELAADGSVP